MFIEKAKDFLYDNLFAQSHTLDKNSNIAKPLQFRWLWLTLAASAMLFLVVSFWPLWPLVLCFWVWYEVMCIGRIQLYYVKDEKNEKLIQQCPRLHKPFRPTPYATVAPWFSGHLQTFIHEFVRVLPDIKFNREYLNTKDGGILTLDHYPMPSFNEYTPIMIIIHGVVGGSHTQYIRHYARLLEKNGIRPVVMNARGCSMSELKTPRYFACHFTEDIRFAVEHVHQLYPEAKLFATAYSLGANILTKYLGEEGNRTPLSGAITLANPFDWPVIDEWLRRPINRHIYNFILTKSLLGYLKRHQHVFSDCENVDMQRVLAVRTLQDYDLELTCKLWGFSGLEEYYSGSSGKLFLENIQIPFLSVQALDDPILPPKTIPFDAFEKNKNLILATTSVGGHIAWLEGLFPTGNNWADYVCVEFTQSILNELKNFDLSNI